MSSGLPVRGPEGPGAAEAALDLRVPEMDCPQCVTRIEERLEKLPGVREAVGNPVSRRLRVAYDGSLVDRARLRHEIGVLGYRALESGAEALAPSGAWRGWAARRTYASMGLFAAGFLWRAMASGGAIQALPPRLPTGPDALFLLAALVGGWNFFPTAVRSVRARALDMNFLMTIAILGAVGIGEYPEAAAIAFLFSLAELLETFAVDRARRSVESLLELSPSRATVVREGREVAVGADELVRGDLVIVRPGERIPADGIVEEGASAVDESPITGEAMPAEKFPGAEVFAGTINAQGFLRARVSRSSRETTLAGIIRLVEEAEGRKAPSERFVRRFARVYTPAVTLAAVLLATLPPLALGAPFATWFLRGLTLLVIACPCALVISTPVAVVSGITAAARNGVLIKGGDHLEAMGTIDVVAFDKTGTLTHGHPEVTDVLPAPGRTVPEVLGLAAAVEALSEHPIARAIVRAAFEREVGPARGGVTRFEAIAGRGAAADVDGERVTVGSPRLFRSDARLDADVVALRDGGATPVVVGPTDAPVGVIGLRDRVRDGAAGAIAALRASGVRRVVMLTGDDPSVAAAIGADLELDEIHAGLLPHEKVELVRRLESSTGRVAMVGDGVNDGPALAAATVGIAMGAAGSDTALETADVALMGDDLSRLPYVYRLSRRGRRVIRQSIAASIAVKGLLAVGVPLGLVSLVAAVLAGDMGTSLAVTGNALRLADRNP
ncbi:MAG: heavy metal translocating P-type ATPase [Gemmatimonadota bacterium]